MPFAVISHWCTVKRPERCCTGRLELHHEVSSGMLSFCLNSDMLSFRLDPMLPPVSEGCLADIATTRVSSCVRVALLCPLQTWIACQPAGGCQLAMTLRPMRHLMKCSDKPQIECSRAAWKTLLQDCWETSNRHRTSPQRRQRRPTRRRSVLHRCYRPQCGMVLPRTGPRRRRRFQLHPCRL